MFSPGRITCGALATPRIACGAQLVRKGLPRYYSSMWPYVGRAQPRVADRRLTTVCNVQPFLQLSPCSLFRARLMQVCDAVHALDSTFGKCSPCNWMQHVHSQRGTCMESVKAETQGLATLLPTSAPYIAKQINSISS